MLLRPYISDALTNVLAVVFLCLGYLSFGYAEYFDRLFIAFLIALLVFKISNANAVSIALIFLFERVFEEAIFLFYSYSYVKPLIYLLAFYVVKLLWYDSLVKKLIFPTIVICFSLEVFWYLNLYEPPQLYFYLAMLILNAITRHFIFLRIPIFQNVIPPIVDKELFLDPLKQINLDWKLYSLSKANCIVIVVMIGEYIMRHMTPYDSIYIYDLYPFAMQAISVVTLFFITLFVIKSEHKLVA